jgi:hypothetical protein
MAWQSHNTEICAEVVQNGLTASNQGWSWTQLDKVGRVQPLAADMSCHRGGCRDSSLL